MTKINKFPNLAPLLNHSSSAATHYHERDNEKKARDISSPREETVKNRMSQGSKRGERSGHMQGSKLSEGKKQNSMIEKFFNRSIRFELVKELGTVVAKILDKKTGKVIRQIPPEELIEVAKQINADGRLLNKEA